MPSGNPAGNLDSVRMKRGHETRDLRLLKFIICTMRGGERERERERRGREGEKGEREEEKERKRKRGREEEKERKRGREREEKRKREREREREERALHDLLRTASESGELVNEGSRQTTDQGHSSSSVYILFVRHLPQQAGFVMREGEIEEWMERRRGHRSLRVGKEKFPIKRHV